MSEIDPKEIKYTVPVEYTITEYDLDCLLVTAFEGGINYWARINLRKGHGYFDAKVHDFEEADRGDCVLTREKLLAGIKLCATKYPRHFKDFIDESGDATTADVIVQCALFGEVVYG
jgi:hypothetical protein